MRKLASTSSVELVLPSCSASRAFDPSVNKRIEKEYLRLTERSQLYNVIITARSATFPVSRIKVKMDH